MSRARETLSVFECTELLKTHVAFGIADEGYVNSNVDAIVTKYCAFLCATASRTPRLNKRTVEQAARDLWSLPVGSSKLFASQMETALSHCRSKIRGMTDGSKLTPAVKKVLFYTNTWLIFSARKTIQYAQEIYSEYSLSIHAIYNVYIHVKESAL